MRFICLSLASLILCPSMAFADPSQPSVESLLSQAKAYAQIGRTGDADRDYQNAVREAEKVGSRNPQLMDALGQQADFYENRGDFANAQKSFKRQLDLQRSINPGDDSRVAGSMRRLAKVYASEGNYHESASLLRDAVSMYERISDRAVARHDMSASKDRMALADCLEQLSQTYNQAETGSKQGTEMQQRAQNIRANPMGR